MSILVKTSVYLAREADNTNCCGSGPHTSGLVKIMRGCGDSNLILCKACWDHEITWRRERNREIAEYAHYQLPSWYLAEIYKNN